MNIKVSLPKPEGIVIEIWDKYFNVQMSQAMMIDRWLGLYERADALKNRKPAKGKQTLATTKAVRSLLQDCQSFIDDLFGEGSAFELFGKTPVGVTMMINVIKVIVSNATDGYARQLESYD